MARQLVSGDRRLLGLHANPRWRGLLGHMCLFNDHRSILQLCWMFISYSFWESARHLVWSKFWTRQVGSKALWLVILTIFEHFLPSNFTHWACVNLWNGFQRRHMPGFITQANISENTAGTLTFQPLDPGTPKSSLLKEFVFCHAESFVSFWMIKVKLSYDKNHP